MTAQIVQFQRELDLSSKAKAFLEERFCSARMLDVFQVGFCPPSSSYSFDLLNGRIIVPIFNTYGEHVAFAGRRMDAYSKQVMEYYQSKLGNYEAMQKFLKWKTSKWINTPYKKSNYLFNLDKAKRKIYEKNFCFLVEGYFDAMHLFKLGYENVVALCGTSLTDTQAELIYRYCDRCVIMLDGDDAGQTASTKSALKARNKNVFANIVKLPDGCDPDDLGTEQLDFVVETISSSEEEFFIEL